MAESTTLWQLRERTLVLEWGQQCRCHRVDNKRPAEDRRDDKIEQKRVSNDDDKLLWNNLVNCIGVTLAFLGFLSPMLAAGIHVISKLIFILNSARLIQ